MHHSRTGRWLPALLVGLLFNPVGAVAQGAGGGDWAFGGHGKYGYSYTRLPGNSALQAIGDDLQAHSLDARFRAAFHAGRWSLETHAQLIGVRSDLLKAGHTLAALLPGSTVISDDRRWFDLTHEFNRHDDKATLARLDRASIGYTGDKAVLRFGRQAVSWGSGMLFTPMDIFNPFDPTAVDKEYKTGDDMLYAQYLQDNGNDLQAVAVVRRDLVSGNVEQDQSSLALKYHGFWGGSEYDLLLAEHYDDRVFGASFSSDLGGAVWRTDLVWTDTRSGGVFSTVAGASYSGVLGGRNWTGFLEYFYNGHGVSDGFSAQDLAAQPDLLQRLARGELYNLGRHYLGASVTLEMTPLVLLTPNLFVNLEDPSALAQLVLAWDWQENIQLLGALSVPLGPDGSEYGGIEVEQGGPYLSTGASLFAQLAWYF
ncbi:MAG: hypothetical protein PVJ71_00335 [Lysobacterales bacterium]|jgi:hypothetical protein